MFNGLKLHILRKRAKKIVKGLRRRSLKKKKTLSFYPSWIRKKKTCSLHLELLIYFPVAVSKTVTIRGWTIAKQKQNINKIMIYAELFSLNRNYSSQNLKIIWKLTLRSKEKTLPSFQRFQRWRLYANRWGLNYNKPKSASLWHFTALVYNLKLS